MKPYYQDKWVVRAFPNPILHEKAKPIKKVTSNIVDLAAKMMSIMDNPDQPLYGLAAPQLGEGIRMICIRWGMECIILINPEIIKKSKSTFVSVEGCASLPRGVTFNVKRANIVKARGTLLNGETRILKGHSTSSACIQHEVDHLDGILINQQR